MPLTASNNSLFVKRQQAFLLLEKCENKKIRFLRKVFFLPGWASEKCNLWEKPFSAENTTMGQWAQKIIENHQETVHFLNFSKAESDRCLTFEALGKLLYSKIEPFLKDQDEVFDIVGYSMGGLDVCSAIVFGSMPYGRIGKIITLGCPFCGQRYASLVQNLNVFFWAFFGSWLLVRYLIYRFFGYTEANISQLESLRPDGRYIKEMDTKEHRLKLLSAVEKLYVFYGQDDRFLGENASFDKQGIDEKLIKERLGEFSFEGARHYGTWVLIQDPRVILKIMAVLSGKELDKAEGVL